MIELPNSKKKDGIYFLSDDSCLHEIEKIYLNVRNKEGRIYSDGELKSLPELPANHPLHNEWKVRQKSAQALLKYFSSLRSKLILDLGCGNCWLSNLLSESTNNFVFALDINKFELKQGERVFGKNQRLIISCGNIFEDIFPPQIFDYIIIASAVQYFENISDLIDRLLILIKQNGEIHIIDSNFYNDDEIIPAKKRTELYYKELGFPEMSGFYHHHKWSELKKYNYQVLNKQEIIFTKLNNRLRLHLPHMFPWIRIKNC